MWFIQLFEKSLPCMYESTSSSKYNLRLPVSIWYDLIHGIVLLSLKIGPFTSPTFPTIFVPQITPGQKHWNLGRWRTGTIPDGFSCLCWWCSVEIMIMFFWILIKVCFDARRGAEVRHTAFVGYHWDSDNRLRPIWSFACRCAFWIPLGISFYVLVEVNLTNLNHNVIG